MRLFGIYRTESNYAVAIVRGMMAFYGFPFPPSELAGPSGWEKVFDVAINLALAPGYYATITKQVLRDMEQVVTAATDFGNAMGVTGVITQIFKLIDALFSSTTFRFINILAQVGDQVYRANYQYGQIAHAGAKVVMYEKENQNTVLNPKARLSSQSRFKVGKGWIGKYNLYTYGSLLLPNPY